MRSKAKLVIIHSDGDIVDVAVFTGKNKDKEAKRYFEDVVVEDMRSQDEASATLDGEFDEKDARREARALKGNYTSDSDDVDILILSAR